ncbi:hypothetical protein [Sphingobium sp. CFD-2]|uniref:hypothetical protein n=1 Tax=Sphingobium sp. CFD-2 TaxID=2878542 RepID=UPI00214CE404|nr:hypothetical protein [Sphingobium sp. CFD-2]
MPQFTFRALERDYQWYDRMDEANAALRSAVPPGSSFWKALDTLRSAGAQCVGDNRDRRLARCTYSERIIIDDYHPADAIWTVLLHLQDGEAVDLTMSRDIDKR